MTDTARQNIAEFIDSFLQTQIVDIDGLASVLKTSKDVQLRQWKRYPHIFVGNGKTARSARFIVADVLNFLRAEGQGYVGVQAEGRSVGGFMGIQISGGQKAIPEKRVQNKKGGGSGGGRKTKKSKNRGRKKRQSDTTDDRYNVFQIIKAVPDKQRGTD